MWESIMKFLSPILQQVTAGAATQGVNKLMSPNPVNDPNSIRGMIQSGQVTRQGLQSGNDVPAMAPAQGAGLVPAAPPGTAGSGTTNNPSGGLNFSGGYTGGPDPRQAGGNAPAGPPSSGFTTMGYPLQDQQKLQRGINSGFQGI